MTVNVNSVYAEKLCLKAKRKKGQIPEVGHGVGITDAQYPARRTRTSPPPGSDSENMVTIFTKLNLKLNSQILYSEIAPLRGGATARAGPGSGKTNKT